MVNALEHPNPLVISRPRPQRHHNSTHITPYILSEDNCYLNAGARNPGYSSGRAQGSKQLLSCLSLRFAQSFDCFNVSLGSIWLRRDSRYDRRCASLLPLFDIDIVPAHTPNLSFTDTSFTCAWPKLFRFPSSQNGSKSTGTKLSQTGQGLF